MRQFTTTILTVLIARDWFVSATEERVRPMNRKPADGTRKIVGGRIVNPIERYPYMVEFWPNPGCGGSLIHPQVVLTAAHCVDSDGFLPNTVDIGRWNWKDAVSGDTYDSIKTKSLIIHPDWNPSSCEYDSCPDFALVRLKEDSTMRPVKLSDNSNNDSPNGTPTIVMGFGRIDDGNNKYSAKLKEADLDIVSGSNCPNGFKSSFEICADDTQNPPKGNSCNGDSGGPLIVDGGDASNDLQVGIVSWGPRTCFGNAAVYSRVSWAYDWIEQTMADEWGLTLGDGLGPVTPSPPTPTPPTPTPPAPTPTSTPSCKDSTRPFLVNFRDRKCDWVAKASESRCAKGNFSVATHCPKTCGLCNTCVDAVKRFYLKNGKLKSCEWVANKQSNNRCKKIGDKHTCRKTCGAC